MNRKFKPSGAGIYSLICCVFSCLSALALLSTARECLIHGLSPYWYLWSILAIGFVHICAPAAVTLMYPAERVRYRLFGYEGIVVQTLATAILTTYALIHGLRL